jgi:hypothetical protein
MTETLGIMVLWLIVIIAIGLGGFLWLVDIEASRIGGMERSRLPKIMVAVGIALAALMLAGCVTTPVIGDIPQCERLVPPVLVAPTESVEVPDSEDALPWQQAFNGQTGQLDKANDKAPAVDHIYRTCLVLHREALARSKRGFFGRLFGR